MIQHQGNVPRAPGGPQRLVYVVSAEDKDNPVVQHSDSVVLTAFTRSKQRYGAPRLTDELCARGYHFNVKAVTASLRRQGQRAKASRKFGLVTYLARSQPVPENLLEQDFYASGPNQKWAGDITYLRTDEGWLYLAVAIDLWSRTLLAGQCRHA